MNFVSANSDLFIIIGLIIGTLAFGMGIIPYLQRKKFISIEGVQISQELLQILKLLLIEMNFKDKTIKEQTTLILDIIEDILEYIESELQITDIEQKKKVAYEMVINILNDLEIEVNENRQKLIKLTIEEALKIEGS